MVEHSAIDNAELACQIASEAPIYSQEDHDAILELVQDANRTLMNVYLGGQIGNVPDDWKIGWFECRRALKALELAETKIVQRYRATKFFAGQRRKDRAAKIAKDNIESTNWQPLGNTQVLTHKDKAGNVHEYSEDLGAAAFQRMKQQGFNVRKIETSKGTKYEYATIRDISKGKV